MRTIFHITTSQAWAAGQAADRYVADSLAAEGFIHLSRPHQLLATAQRHFPGATDLVLLQVNQEKVAAPVKYEGAEGNPFPHIYGPLNLDAVVSEHLFAGGPAGFTLPEPFQLVGDTLIRPGQPGDEAEIASVHTHAWQQSYKGIVPDVFLAERPLSFRARLNWWKGVAEGRDPWKVVVAESAEHGIIGFCGFGPAREDGLKEHGEIGAIYCLNEYMGKGIGAALLRQAHRRQKAAGYRFSYLWVLQGNPTIEFYRRRGGIQLEQTKNIELGGKSLIELAFEWRLQD